MTIEGKWIQLRDGESLGAASFEDCVIVTGRTPPLLTGHTSLLNCTVVPPAGSGLCGFFRKAEWEGRAGYAVHEPEVLAAIARKDRS